MIAAPQQDKVLVEVYVRLVGVVTVSGGRGLLLLLYCIVAVCVDYAGYVVLYYAVLCMYVCLCVVCNVCNMMNVFASPALSSAVR